MKQVILSRAKALVVLACVLPAQALAESCDSKRVDLRWPGGQSRFAVEIADTDRLRMIGLQHRERLGRFEGMLFVYPSERPVAFWMKNTLIPLDLLFFDGQGILQKIHRNAIPLDLTSLPGGRNIQYVLEINAGMSDKVGVKLGAEIRHPAVSNDLAAWPCGKVEN
ncbi:hypothetical protein GCM10007939_02420 [Amylibacter marinus]|uniref:DUF192 domain-containing protein n=1 Tax=Amylibacter marinus TaxID=1475483 RepID=A0ABQ5VRY0_9RHOB|nr:DUF192 domain-containing protein [Amylibacter marinus]GLQ33959.1 hypothetical protein GCM10007939_02420 [Amylibacter marinus]